MILAIKQYFDIHKFSQNIKKTQLIMSYRIYNKNYSNFISHYLKLFILKFQQDYDFQFLQFYQKNCLILRCHE